MRVFYSPYLLKPRKKFTGIYKENRGLLLKIVSADGLESYSAYHPIESLGDVSVEVFLKDSSKRDVLLNKITNLSIKEGEVLSGEVQSYFLASSLKDLLRNLSEIELSGFKLVKLKAASLEDIDFDCLKTLPFEYIFDFNGCEKTENFLKLNTSLQNFLRNRVKYIEDPYKEIQNTGFTIASDFIEYGNLESFNIVKPAGVAHEIPSRLLESDNLKKVVVTSYLDHPLGQLLAAKWAFDHNIKNECGLWTHHLFDQTKYSELFRNKKSIDLSVTKDFVYLLKNEEWKEV